MISGKKYSGLRDVTLCRFESLPTFRKIKCLQNVCNYTPNDTASHITRRCILGKSFLASKNESAFLPVRSLIFRFSSKGLNFLFTFYKKFIENACEISLNAQLIEGRVMWRHRWAVSYVQCDISWGAEKLRKVNRVTGVSGRMVRFQRSVYVLELRSISHNISQNIVH
jgi:hypothetical protein